MKKRFGKQVLSMAVAVAMIASLVVPTGINQAGGNAAAAEKKVQYTFAKAEYTLSENDAPIAITVVRQENLNKEETITVNAYDVSTNYGKDYTLSYDAKDVKGIASANSVFDAFRDKAELVLQESEFESLIQASSQAEDSEDVDVEQKDASAFAAFEDAGAKAASIQVAFAKGQQEATIIVVPEDDADSEYDESFVLGIDSKNNDLEQMTTISIFDNEKKLANNIISFIGTTAQVDSEAYQAKVEFYRTGNLATISKAVIYKDDQAFGSISFSPYQTKQIVHLPVGNYHLADGSSCATSLDTFTVTVKESQEASTKDKQDADGKADTAKSIQSKDEKAQDVKEISANQELDTIYPYDAFKTESTDGKLRWHPGQLINKFIGHDDPSDDDGNGSWMPEWAKTASQEKDTYFTIVGSANNEQFGLRSGGYGNNHAYLCRDANMYCMDTTGGASLFQSSECGLMSKVYYDLTGVESVETRGRVFKLMYTANITAGFEGLETNNYGQNVKKVDKSQYDIKIDVPKKTQSSYRFYYGNKDPGATDDGTHFYVPNGLKFNKRKYLAKIENAISEQVDSEHPASENLLTYVDKSNATQEVSFNAMNMFQNVQLGSTVQLTLEGRDAYPVTLVGYRIKSQSNKYSDMIKVGEDSANVKNAGSQNCSYGFNIDRTFLKNYEKSYAFETEYEDDEVLAFDLYPVVKKQIVNHNATSDIVSNDGAGTLVLENEDKHLYKGDYANFSAKNLGADYTFEGVTVERRMAGSIDGERVNYMVENDGKAHVLLYGDYDNYTFYGIFSKKQNQVTVKYAEGAKEHGTVTADENGVVVRGDEYQMNEYASLIASPKEGYVAKWTDAHHIYYGNVVHHQMDKLPENDAFTIDFVPEKDCDLVTQDLNGTLQITNINMHDSNANGVLPLANKSFSIFADKEYKGKTDENGKFTIKDFKAVNGGDYTMSVVLESSFAYLPIHIEKDKTDYAFTVPQFSGLPIYPYKVIASIGGINSQNAEIPLKENASAKVNVIVRQTDEKAKISKVLMHFYRLADNGDVVGEASTVEGKLNTNFAANDGLSAYKSYTATVDSKELAVNTYLYVETIGTKELNTYDSKGQISGVTQVDITSGDVYTGYKFVTNLVDDSLPVKADIPTVPGMQMLSGDESSKLEIPFLGEIDFSFSGKNGGYFINQAGPDNTYYLVLGYNIVSYWAKPLPDQINSAQNMKKAVDATKAQLKESNEKGKPAGDAKDAGMNVVSDSNNKNKKDPMAAVKMFSPTFMLKFTLKNAVDEYGHEHTYFTTFDFAVGMDERIMKTIATNIDGLPVYINVMFDGEQMLQAKIDLSEQYIDWMTTDMTKFFTADDYPFEIAGVVPRANLTLKAGVGFNNLAGIYVDGKISPSLFVDGYHDMIKCDDETESDGIDYAITLGGGLGIGVDLAIFNLSMDASFEGVRIGSPASLDKLELLKATNLKAVADSFDPNLTDGSSEDIAKKLNAQKFVVAPRNKEKSVLRAAKGATDYNTLVDGTFRGAKVKLEKLDDDKLMAITLADNGVKDSSYNFLSVVTAISSDGGNTWSDVNKVSASSDLQYGAKTYVVGNRVLVTWSEGDMDAQLENTPADTAKLPVGEVAKALNNFDLKGRFYKMDGTPDGEAFTLVEAASAACSVLCAQEHNGEIYAYYQRTPYNINSKANDELVNQESTISYVMIQKDANSVTVKLADKQVLAQSKDGDLEENYRIIEVEPFTYKGIAGEVLVIDSDGKLLVEDENGDLVPSIEDRRIVLRINSCDDGTLQPGELIALTPDSVCAQNVHVETLDDQLYLFFNQDGKISYFTNFLTTKEEYDEMTKDMDDEVKLINSPSLVVDTTTKKLTITGSNIYSYPVVPDGNEVTYSKEYIVEKDDAGNVLVAWIGDKDVDSAAISRNEIFGLMLQIDEQGVLNPIGAPVALTDENVTMNHVDAVCVGENEFILAYTTLDGDTVFSSKHASVVTCMANEASDLEITDVKIPDYPTLGSTVNAIVTVKNNGLKSVDDFSISVDKMGGESPVDCGALASGHENIYEVALTIPEDLSDNTTLNFTATAEDSSDSLSAKVLCGAHFVTVGYPEMENIKGTTDYATSIELQNVGNKAGKASVSYETQCVGGVDVDCTGTFSGNDMIAPQGKTILSGILTETQNTNGKNMTAIFRTGDGYQQSVERVIPVVHKVETASVDPTNPVDPGKKEDATTQAKPGQKTEATTQATQEPKVYGLEKGKTFTAGVYKYKVTKKATDAKNGKVQLVGVTKKGLKKSSLSVATSVKLAGKKDVYETTSYQVTSIGSKAFAGAKAKKITLNKKITTIPSGAFKNCKKLKKLVVKGKLKTVKKNAFKGCKNIIKVSGASSKVRKANVKKLKASGYKKLK